MGAPPSLRQPGGGGQGVKLTAPYNVQCKNNWFYTATPTFTFRASCLIVGIAKP